MQIRSLRIKWSLKIVELKSTTRSKRKKQRIFTIVLQVAKRQTIGEHLLLLLLVCFIDFQNSSFLRIHKEKRSKDYKK